MEITLTTVALVAVLYFIFRKDIRPIAEETKVTTVTMLKGANALAQTATATAVLSANASASAYVTELEQELKEGKATLLSSQDLLKKAGL